jgi:hypothetical protein
MNEMKDKIFDLIYGEITDNTEVQRVTEAAMKDPELKKYYDTLKTEKEALEKSAFVSVSDDLLEKNRKKLSAEISELSPNAPVFINNYVKNFAKYAAVVLLTFYATMYHFGNKGGKVVTESPEVAGLKRGSIPYRTVAVESGENIYGGIDMSKYKVENLNIDEAGGELIINFDVSTNKVIRGQKNDPEIINTLNYLAQHEENPGVRFKTMKAMDISGDSSFTKTLIKVMTSDKDPLIRRKAMKMISDKAGETPVREALFQTVLNDADQTNRIEALGILEKVDSKYADKALKSISSENSEYFRFKAGEFDSNEKKGQ